MMFATKLFRFVFVLVLVTLFAVAGCTDPKGQGETGMNVPADVPVNVTADVPSTNHAVRVVESESDFQTITQSGVVLVDFTAVWCPPCQKLAPILDEVAKNVQGKAVVAKVDIDNHPSLAKKFEVRSIPALIIFKDGQIVDQMVGLKDAATLEAAIEKAAK